MDYSLVFSNSHHVSWPRRLSLPFNKDLIYVMWVNAALYFRGPGLLNYSTLEFVSSVQMLRWLSNLIILTTSWIILFFDFCSHQGLSSWLQWRLSRCQQPSSCVPCTSTLPVWWITSVTYLKNRSSLATEAHRWWASCSTTCLTTP